jgi:hypothetical protein
MRSLPVLLGVLFLVACKADPVMWGEPVFRGGPQSPRDSIARTTIADSAMCPVSVRVAAAGNTSYAAWWRVNADSSSSLMVARANADGSWNKPVVADSTDHSNRGCGRPAPAIAVDTVSGYVHVAYFLEPAAGPGIFFAHSMDSGVTFHSPVPVVFGKTASRVSIATRGDKVAVAYEDPNAQQPMIGVALSKTMGHIFEARVQATPDNGRAMQPVVRIDRDSLRLWWREYSADSSVSATRPAYRAGEWR